MMNDRFDLNGIFESDRERKRSKSQHHRRITLREYLELVVQDPAIAQNSHARLVEIIEDAGVSEIPEEERGLFIAEGDEVTKRYNLFAQELFGIEAPTSQFVSIIKAGAKGLSTGKQIILFVGPTGSGKSSFVRILMRALEKYDKRPVFMIQGCPRFEEPLHLLPRYMREQVALKPEECPEYPNCKNKHLHLGIKIEGDLDPPCRARLMNEFTKENGSVEWWNFPVETFNFSITSRRGIGSFEPTEEKNQDIGVLVGRENLQITTTEGYNHPNAFDLSGDLQVANRGIFEGRELIKSPEEFMWIFISVAEEKEIKVHGSNFPHMSIDTVVVGHTNLTEYKKFASNKANEALHDRIYVIPFPYPLRVKDEIKVYRKLIEQESAFRKVSSCHIAPGSLEIAATFAVLTRLRQESKFNIDPLTKAKIINGELPFEIVDDDKPIDVQAIIKEGQEEPDISKRDGMFGMSSRDVLAAINIELVKNENGCLTPLTVIRALKNVFDHRMGYSAEEIERFRSILSEEDESIMGEYKRFVVESVKKAFLRSYRDLAEKLFNKYIENAELFRDRHRRFIRGGTSQPKDKLGAPKEADIKFLESIERFMDIDSEEAPVFRGEILELRSKIKDFSYHTYPPLARAIDERLLADNKASLSLVLSADKPKGEEEKKRAQDLFDGLSEAGFCDVCAREVIEEAAKFLSE